jgi:phosphoenolpyruvate carboxykinase (GTP)
VILRATRALSVVHGDINRLAPKVRKFVEENATVCQPDKVHICDGTEAENTQLLNLMQQQGMIKPLSKYDNK